MQLPVIPRFGMHLDWHFLCSKDARWFDLVCVSSGMIEVSVKSPDGITGGRWLLLSLCKMHINNSNDVIGSLEN